MSYEDDEMLSGREDEFFDACDDRKFYRNEVAARMMQALVANGGYGPQAAASVAIEYADALIAALERSQNQ